MGNNVVSSTQFRHTQYQSVAEEFWSDEVDAYSGSVSAEFWESDKAVV